MVRTPGTDSGRCISVPNNIAEGKGRHSDKDFQHFLFIARGSLLELETQLLLAQRPNFLTEEQAIALLQVSGEGCRGINALINSIGAGTMTTASGR